MFMAISSFISYWYFRYLLVTELYMVEKWERTMFHIVLILFLWLLYSFNAMVILGFVKTFTGWIINLNEDLPGNAIQ